MYKSCFIEKKKLIHENFADFADLAELGNMSLAVRVLPFCANSTDTNCMTEPWAPRDNGFVWFLNFVLAFVFPIIPWEIFFFLPWVLLCLAKRAVSNPSGKLFGKLSHVILVVNLYFGVYGGIAHPAGLIQAFSTLGGGEGICVVHPPPNADGAVGPPFKLYYGFKQHPWCTWLALHVILVSLAGWYFLFLICKDRKAAKKNGYKILLSDPPISTFYARCAVGFSCVGFGQLTPYIGALSGTPGSLLVSTGGYSKRMFSPGLTEFLAALSFCGSGLFFTVMYLIAKKGAPVHSSVEISSAA